MRPIIRAILYQILQFLLPFHSMAYFKVYLDTSYQISTLKNPNLQLKYLLTILLLLYISLHNLYLALFIPQTSRSLILHYDLPILIFNSNLYNCLWFTFAFNSALIYYIFYFTPNSRINSLIYQILFQSDCTPFLASQYKVTPICELIQKLVLRIHNSCQLFLIVCSKYF